MEQRNRAGAKTLRLHQTIARDIGTAILAGRYKPGETFGGEIEQSEQRGVSRTAYREAVRILAAKGLLESRPKTGTRVTPRSRWNLLDPEVLAWMFAGDLDGAFVSDLLELRSVIEPAASALAARRRSDAQLEEMAGALERMQSHGLATPEGRAADQLFHRAILQAAGNEALAALASSVAAGVSCTTIFQQQGRVQPRDPLPGHVAVYEAIRDRDSAGATAAMTDLVRLVREDLSAVLPAEAAF